MLHEKKSAGMKVVTVRGFFFDADQNAAPSSPQSTSDSSCIVVKVALPGDISSLQCKWLMEAANDEFMKVGVKMSLVGLLSPVEEDSEDAEDPRHLVPAWMIEPSTLLDTMDLTKEFEAVFICEKLCVQSTTGKPTKVTASDFEFIRLLGEGAAGRVFQVRRRKTNRMYAVCVLGIRFKCFM